MQRLFQPHVNAALPPGVRDAAAPRRRGRHVVRQLECKRLHDGQSPSLNKCDTSPLACLFRPVCSNCTFRLFSWQ